ncbi:MAG TPA: type II secretion system minor pseudopilin GspK [Rhizobiaceae bacterium]|nr:type II secretion system minor pseudopilin GspK [Rhizobiaceae bacterium]
MTVLQARPEESRQGFVIVAVLWILIALSSLAMIFAVYLAASAQAMAVSDTSLQNEALVSASVELAAYRLIVAGDDARPARGAFHFRMDDADVAVTFTSEAARIDLNFASKEVLAAFFAGLGAGKDAAAEDAERIIGWRTRPIPGSANDEEPRYAALGYSPRQSLFVNVDEIALVAGLSPALVERALPFLTVFNGSGEIDSKIAAPEVVAAFAKDSRAANDPFGGQMGASGSSLASPGVPLADADPAVPKADTAAAKSPCYRIHTTIGFANGSRSVSEVVIALGDKNEPYHVLAWQDGVRPGASPGNARPVRRRS